MDAKQEQLNTIRDIKNLMEGSSRFLSLSGLAGVFVGLVAIGGVAAAYVFLDLGITQQGYYKLATMPNGVSNTSFYLFYFSDALIMLALSLIVGVWMAMRKARKLQQPVWSFASKRLLLNMAIPLLAGGAYGLALLYQGHIELVAPATLIFYGMALLNASKYTINDIRYLGIMNIITGLVASVFVDFGLLFWAFGFGILHMVYGLSIYLKYEK